MGLLNPALTKLYLFGCVIFMIGILLLLICIRTMNKDILERHEEIKQLKRQIYR